MKTTTLGVTRYWTRVSCYYIKNACRVLVDGVHSHTNHPPHAIKIRFTPFHTRRIENGDRVNVTLHPNLLRQTRVRRSGRTLAGHVIQCLSSDISLDIVAVGRILGLHLRSHKVGVRHLSREHLHQGPARGAARDNARGDAQGLFPGPPPNKRPGRA